MFEKLLRTPQGVIVWYCVCGEREREVPAGWHDATLVPVPKANPSCCLVSGPSNKHADLAITSLLLMKQINQA